MYVNLPSESTVVIGKYILQVPFFLPNQKIFLFTKRYWESQIVDTLQRQSFNLNGFMAPRKESIFRWLLPLPSLKLTANTPEKWMGLEYEDIVSYSGPQPRWRVVSGRVVLREAKFNHLVIQSDLFGMVKWPF